MADRKAHAINISSIPAEQPPNNDNKKCITDEVCDVLWGWAIICFFVALIVVPITVDQSFHYVRYDEFGFAKNRYGTVDTSKVLAPGDIFIH